MLVTRFTNEFQGCGGGKIIPAKEILSVVTEENPTIVVIAASGERKSYFGSTVDAVVRRAEIPILVFK